MCACRPARLFWGVIFLSLSLSLARPVVVSEFSAARLTATSVFITWARARCALNGSEGRANEADWKSD